MNSFTIEQAEAMRDSLYFSWIILYKEKIFIKTSLKLREYDIMSSLRKLTNGEDEISKEYFANLPKPVTGSDHE